MARNVGQRTPRRRGNGEARMPAWFFASLRGYRIGWLPRDIVAGIMLAAIAIPGQLATARLAGMPPETGLYAFAAGSLAFAAFGANRFMSVAADSTIAPIFAGGLASMAAVGTAALCRAGDAARPHGRRHPGRGRLAPRRLARNAAFDPRDDRLSGGHRHPHHRGRVPDAARHIRGARASSAAPASHPRPPGGGQSLYARARRRRAGCHLGHGEDQFQGSRGTDRRGRGGRRRGAVPSADPRREPAGRTAR